MKRANCMNVKLNTLLYIALFSGLGIFSFLLLINYAT
ncbi:histidine kinase, partial [Bacteroides thetaiotaomicron]